MTQRTLQPGQSGRCRFTDTISLTPGGEAVASRLPPPPPGRRYRLDPDPGGSGAYLVMVVTDDASAQTGDAAAVTPASINARNQAFWSRQSRPTP